MKSNNIDEDEWSEEDVTTAPKSDGFRVHNSILITVFLGAFVLWNCGSIGIFSFFRVYSFPAVWDVRDVMDFLSYEVGGFWVACFQTIIFMYACHATNAIGVRINKNQSK